jgi:anti-sigma regulatory factor (Ser/Thr protein kinase)
LDPTEPEDHREQATAELRLSGTRDVQDAAGAMARAIAAKAGIDAARLTRLRAVVEELVREARARQVAASSDEIVVRVIADAGQLDVEVTDQALPVDPKEARHAASRRLAALGFVDQLEIGTQGKRGNVARCSLRIAPAESELAGDTIAPDAARVSDEEAAAVEIREMRPEDAGELVRCVYRCYGYSYKAALLYDPKEIKRALRTGTMSSVVAATPEGEVVGHCAVFVERLGDAVPEAGRLIVDPRYRGHGVASRMAMLRWKLAQESTIPGFWAEAVTNHAASQREVLGAGGIEVGLLIGGSPAAVDMVGFDSAGQKRRTLLAMYTPLRRAAQTIHLPERHAELVGRLADRLAAEREIVTDAVEPSGRTKLWTSVEGDSAIARLRVDRVGGDVASRVADSLEGLDAFDLGVVHLDVPVADPASGTAIEALEPLGFSLAAWVPRFVEGSDMMRLQRTGSHPVETEDIACARAEGEEVRDYVLAEWRRVRRGGVE